MGLKLPEQKRKREESVIDADASTGSVTTEVNTQVSEASTSSKRLCVMLSMTACRGSPASHSLASFSSLGTGSGSGYGSDTRSLAERRRAFERIEFDKMMLEAQAQKETASLRLDSLMASFVEKFREQWPGAEEE